MRVGIRSVPCRAKVAELGSAIEEAEERDRRAHQADQGKTDPHRGVRYEIATMTLRLNISRRHSPAGDRRLDARPRPVHRAAGAAGAGDAVALIGAFTLLYLELSRARWPAV